MTNGTPSTEPSIEKMELYDAGSINACPWPMSEGGQYAKRYLTPFIKQGSSAFIENVKTDLRVLVCGSIVLPVTVNEAEYDNSFVCSPYSYYITYGKQSLDPLIGGKTYHPLKGLLSVLDKTFRTCKINKVVSVNNWLYSTNLYPELTLVQLQNAVRFLVEKFPEHAIVFRSIDPHTNRNCFEQLQKIGLKYIAAREIFFLDPTQTSFFESRLYKSDLKLLENSGYEVIEHEQLKESDLPRLIELYNNLNLEKYSILNPQFNEAFLALMIKNRLLKFKALRKDGRINGAFGCLEKYGKLFCPFFGYDRTMPKDPSLYRMLSTLLMLEAKKKNLFFHESSGASMFKSIRKAQRCIEYTAVYSRHLPFKQRFPWILLEKLCNSIGIFYMKKSY